MMSKMGFIAACGAFMIFNSGVNDAYAPQVSSRSSSNRADNTAIEKARHKSRRSKSVNRKRNG